MLDFYPKPLFSQKKVNSAGAGTNKSGVQIAKIIIMIMIMIMMIVLVKTLLMCQMPCLGKC